MDVGVLKVLLLLVVDLGADTADNDVAVGHCVLDFSLGGEVVKSDEGLVTQIGGGLKLLQAIVPDGGIATVRINALSTNFGEGTTKNGA